MLKTARRSRRRVETERSRFRTIPAIPHPHLFKLSVKEFFTERLNEPGIRHFEAGSMRVESSGLRIETYGALLETSPAPAQRSIERSEAADAVTERSGHPSENAAAST